MSEIVYLALGYILGCAITWMAVTENFEKPIKQCELNLPRNQHCELTAKVKE